MIHYHTTSNIVEDIQGINLDLASCLNPFSVTFWE